MPETNLSDYICGYDLVLRKKSNIKAPKFIDLVSNRFRRTAISMAGYISFMIDGPCRLLCINLINPVKVLRKRKKFCKRMFKAEAKRIKRFKKYNVVRFTNPTIGDDWGTKEV